MVKMNGNRKLIFIAVLIIIGFLIDFFTQRGLSESLLELFKWLGGTYVLGNVGEHFAEAGKKKADHGKGLKEEETKLLLETLDKTIRGLAQGQEVIIQNVNLTNEALVKIIPKGRISAME